MRPGQAGGVDRTFMRVIVVIVVVVIMSVLTVSVTVAVLVFVGLVAVTMAAAAAPAVAAGGTSGGPEVGHDRPARSSASGRVKAPL